MNAESLTELKRFAESTGHKGFIESVERYCAESVPEKSKQSRKIVSISGGIGHSISCICDDGTAWRYVRKYTDDAIAYEGWEMLEPIPQGDCVISLAPRPMPEPPL